MLLLAVHLPSYCKPDLQQPCTRLLLRHEPASFMHKAAAMQKAPTQTRTCSSHAQGSYPDMDLQHPCTRLLLRHGPAAAIYKAAAMHKAPTQIQTCSSHTQGSYPDTAQGPCTLRLSRHSQCGLNLENSHPSDTHLFLPLPLIVTRACA